MNSATWNSLLNNLRSIDDGWLGKSGAALALPLKRNVQGIARALNQQQDRFGAVGRQRPLVALDILNRLAIDLHDDVAPAQSRVVRGASRLHLGDYHPAPVGHA